jgi:hypothetical protein
MNDDELGKLADAWILGVLYGHTEDGRETTEHKKYAWALMAPIDWKYDDEPELLWRFILAVHEKDPDSKVGGHLAAGPVEDLMTRFGTDYIDRVENLARSDDRFRDMLHGTWQDGMSDELWARFQKARAPLL